MTTQPPAEPIEQVRISFEDEVLGITCKLCTSLELVRGDGGMFDEQIRRFLRRHPWTCDEGEPVRRVASA